MPVLTPVDPLTQHQVNTCNHVSELSLELIQSEFKRAYKLIKKVQKGKLLQ